MQMRQLTSSLCFVLSMIFSTRHPAACYDCSKWYEEWLDDQLKLTIAKKLQTGAMPT